MDQGEAGTSDATVVFTEHRELLFSIVYNMLGVVTDTEDVLQETWLAWSGRQQALDEGRIESPRGYLVRIAVNQALARRAAVDRRRETYVGPWLPEPLVASLDEPAEGADDVTLRAEELSMALLVVLETLSPLERAVFVLNEVFGYPHPEVAEILGRSPAAVRQLAHRAREHVHARRPRQRVDPGLHRRATERFLEAAVGGDMDGLLRLLSPDATLWADAGGKVQRASLHPIHGRDKVARFMRGVAGRPPGPLAVRFRRVNGDPSALLFDGDAPFAVLVLDLTDDGEQIRGVYVVGNPEKLGRAS